MDMDALVEAVREHSGMDDDQLRDVADHGADGGWPGFTYYRDTNEFYEKNQELIWQLLDEQADDLGEKHSLAMISGFRAARDVASDNQFRNLLAWYALEEAGRYVADNRERNDE